MERLDKSKQWHQQRLTGIVTLLPVSFWQRLMFLLTNDKRWVQFEVVHSVFVKEAIDTDDALITAGEQLEFATNKEANHVK